MKFLFLFLFFPFLNKAQEPPAAVNVYWTNDSGMRTDDVIYYDPAARVEWPDFKGAPGPVSPVAAITNSGFGYKADMRSSNGKAEINIGVYCFFSKDKSWVRHGKTTSYILNHEQHHFDVSYLAANLFIDKVRNTELSYADCNTVLPKLYRECCDIMNKMQNDYDAQTENGQLDEVQEKWNNFFKEKLLLIPR